MGFDPRYVDHTQVLDSDRLLEEYSRCLDDAGSLEELRRVLTQWKPLAYEALDIVATWGPKDFADFKEALARERAHEFCGDEAMERFAFVILPPLIFAIASWLPNAPTGFNFKALARAGTLRLQRGRYMPGPV